MYVWCTYVYVCIYCICVLIQVWVYLYHICLHTCMHLCMYTCVYVCMSVYYVSADHVTRITGSVRRSLARVRERPQVRGDGNGRARGRRGRLANEPRWARARRVRWVRVDSLALQPPEEKGSSAPAERWHSHLFFWTGRAIRNVGSEGGSQEVRACRAYCAAPSCLARLRRGRTCPPALWRSGGMAFEAVLELERESHKLISKGYEVDLYL